MPRHKMHDIGKTVVIPAVELSLIARWFPKKKVFLLKGDGDEQEGVGLPDVTVSTPQQNYAFGKIRIRLARFTAVDYRRSGSYDADTLDDLWQMIVRAGQQRVRRVNVSRLGIFVQVFGRWVELPWESMTVHPDYFTLASSGSSEDRPGQRLAVMLKEAKDEMVTSGMLSAEERKYLKNSILVLREPPRWPNEKGDWRDYLNLSEIRMALGVPARTMNIIRLSAATTDVEEEEPAGVDWG